MTCSYGGQIPSPYLTGNHVKHPVTGTRYSRCFVTHCFFTICNFLTGPIFNVGHLVGVVAHVYRRGLDFFQQPRSTPLTFSCFTSYGSVLLVKVWCVYIVLALEVTTRITSVFHVFSSTIHTKTTKFL